MWWGWWGEVKHIKLWIRVTFASVCVGSIKTSTVNHHRYKPYRMTRSLDVPAPMMGRGSIAPLWALRKTWVPMRASPFPISMAGVPLRVVIGGALGLQRASGVNATDERLGPFPPSYSPLTRFCGEMRPEVPSSGGGRFHAKTRPKPAVVWGGGRGLGHSIVRERIITPSRG